MFFMIMVFFPSYAAKAYLISEINKDKVFEGEIVKVWGYVYDDYTRENLEVKIFVNGELWSVVKTNEDGYFEQYIKMDEVGINIVEVIYKNEINTYRIVVYKKQPEVEILDDRYYSRIIIVGDKVTTIYPYQYNNEIIKNQYVDVELSTKELSVSRFGGSILKVKIYNHLNETTAFSVIIDGLDDKDYYTSGTLELKPLERGEISIYIAPLNEFDEKEVTLKIKGNEEILAEKKLKIVRANKHKVMEKMEKEELFDFLSIKILSFVLIIAGIFMMLCGIRGIFMQKIRL